MRGNYEKPISTFGYIMLTILYTLPLIGLIALIMNAFSAKNVNVRNFSRAQFIIFIFYYIIYFAVIVVLYYLSLSPEYASAGGVDIVGFVRDILSRIK